MKKSRIVWLTAALLVLATCLTSCGVISNVGKYLNKNYDLTPDMITEAASIEDLKGYTLIPVEDVEDFLLFTNVGEPDETTGKITTSYKVFGVKEGKVIVDVTSNNKNTFVDIDFLDASLVVTKIVIDEKDLEKDLADGKIAAELSAAILALLTDSSKLEEVLDNKLAEDYVTVSYTLYDSLGTEVATSDEKNDARDFGDLVIFDYKAYEVDKESGKLVEKMDVPEYMELGNCTFYNDTYFYVFNESSMKLTVYNRSLEIASVWIAPNYGDDSFDMVAFATLNNGDILFQYTLVQDEDAKKFDYTFVYDGLTVKVDLVTKLISAKTGEAKDLDVNYVIENLYTNEMLYDDELDAEDNVFTDKFDNIATVYYIEDQRLVKTAATKDLVLLSNKGKIQKSLKLVDNQVAELTAIEKVGDDLYMVDTLYGGLTLVKGNGKVVVSLNKYMRVVAGTYLVGERAIYDLELNVVYDLIEKDAEVEKIMSDVIFIKETTKDGYKYVALKADSTETTTVYTYDEEETETTFKFADNALFGYYYIKEADGDIVYYNANGDVIIKTTEEMTYETGSYMDGLMIMSSTDAETGKATYYTFKVGEAEADKK